MDTGQNQLQRDPAEKLGIAIRKTRETQQLTQQDLASRVGFPAPQTVSDIELGKREVKAWELVAIAKVLHVSIDALLGLERFAEPTILWRCGSTGPRRESEAKLVERARRYALLETWCGLPPPPPLPDWHIDPQSTTFEELEPLADDVGRLLDLGSRPAAALVRTLEEGLRIKIFYEAMGQEGSAASTRGDFGAAILMNADEAPWRRNYNFAHEFFHLVTWSSVQEEEGADRGELSCLDRLEKLANAFASRLLLPGDSVSTALSSRVSDGRVAYLDLIEIAREFEVSTQALLWRLVNLRRMDSKEAELIMGDETFRELDRGTMPGRWGEPPAQLPERFHRLALLAYQKGKMSKARLAEFLETSLFDLPDMNPPDESATAASVSVT